MAVSIAYIILCARLIYPLDEIPRSVIAFQRPKSLKKTSSLLISMDNLPLREAVCMHTPSWGVPLRLCKL